MASTFTDLGIELMATGENAGTWGTKTNANLNLIEQLAGGFLSVSIAGGAGTQALDVDDGALTGAAQNRVLEFTGTISGNRIITFPVLTENFYIIKNSTSGAHTVQLKAASGSGATVTFSTTEKGYKIIYLDGVATNTGVYDITSNLNVDDLTVNDLIVNASAIFNESGADKDFRVESDGNANMLFVDGGNNRVGIGTAAPGTGLQVDQDWVSDYGSINVSHSTNSLGGLGIRCNNVFKAALIYKGGTSGALLDLGTYAAEPILFRTNNSEVMRINSNGNIGIGTTNSTAAKVFIEHAGDVDDNGLYVYSNIGQTVPLVKIIQDGAGSSAPAVYIRNDDADGIALHLEKGDSNVTPLAFANQLFIEDDANSGLTIGSPTNGVGSIVFGDSGDADIAKFQYYHDGNSMRFTVNAAEAMRIHSNGVISSVNGIALGVGTANTASNVLDDYEEGTWSPAITTDAGGGNSGVSFGARFGSYTKIGRQVTVNVYVDLDGVTSFGTGNAIVATLPFTSSNEASTYRASVAISYAKNWDEAPSGGQIPNNSTKIFLRKRNTTSALENMSDLVVVGDMNTNSEIMLTATYDTA